MAGGGLFMADLESVIDVVHEFLSCADTESFTEATRQGVDQHDNLWNGHGKSSSDGSLNLTDGLHETYRLRIGVKNLPWPSGKMLGWG
jgi:hypothetical protein